MDTAASENFNKLCYQSELIRTFQEAQIFIFKYTEMQITAHSPSVFDNCCVNNKRLGRRITLIIFLVFDDFKYSIFAECFSQSNRIDCRCFKLIKFEQMINSCAQVLILFFRTTIFQINDNDSREF